MLNNDVEVITMKGSIQLLTESIDKAFQQLNSTHHIANLFNYSPVHGPNVISKPQRYSEADLSASYSAMELALQVADRDHKEVLRRYNQSKKLRAIEEQAAA
jgi:hypothetical protein